MHAAFLAFLVAGLAGAPDDPPVEPLKTKLERLIRESGAEKVALAFVDLKSGEEVFIEPDEVFHAASTMKVPVMMEVYRQAEAGSLSLDEKLTIRNDFPSLADGSPFALDPADDSETSLYEKVGREVAIRDLVRPMIVVSSNLADPAHRASASASRRLTGRRTRRRRPAGEGDRGR